MASNIESLITSGALPLHQTESKMTSEKIRTGTQDRTISLYQVDPGFYNKILSRSNSLGHSNRISVYRSPGRVPFIWEMQPGKPRNEPEIQVSPSIRLKLRTWDMQLGKTRDEPEIQVSPTIRFPPAVPGLNMPRPCITPTGPKAYLLKKFKKVKKIKKIKDGLSPAIHNLSVTRPKINPEEVKSYLWKNIKKVKRITLGKLMKGKHRRKSTGDHHHCNAKTTYDNSPHGMHRNDYGFEVFNSSHADDFTPTKTTTSHSSRSSYLSSFSFANIAIKPPKLLRFWSLTKELMKWRSDNKSTKRTYPF